jgi:hypothetical protein
LSKELWIEYTKGQQPYLQLAKKYNCAKRSVQGKIDLHKVSIPKKEVRKVVVLMDTTYWGRGFGVMLFKDAYTKENLLINIEVIGLFKFSGKVEDVRTFLLLNAPAILFPYVRAYISSMTALSGMDTIVIPTMNLSGMKDELNIYYFEP